MPRLLMFDIDGTLTTTNGVDTECYVQAMSEYLGVAIDSDWSRYQHVTDSGIASELLKLHGRPMEEVSLLQRRFFELIEQALRSRPQSCEPIAGAAEFVEHVQRSADWVAGLATGGWGESARAKLRRAGIDFQGIPFASADDAEARIDIMKSCFERAEAECRGELTGIIYVGTAVGTPKRQRNWVGLLSVSDRRFAQSGTAHGTPTQCSMTSQISNRFWPPQVLYSLITSRIEMLVGPEIKCERHSNGFVESQELSVHAGA